MEQSAELKKAIQTRDEFLQKHPNMRLYQEEIDRALSCTSDPSERMSIIMRLLTKKNNELCEVVNEFYVLFHGLSEEEKTKDVKLEEDFVGEIEWSK